MSVMAAESVLKYLQPDIIAKVGRLDLRARFIVEGFLTGLHASPYHGFSVEFSEHRKYVPGDDLRLIDWAVFGKTDRFYIRKFEAETNLSAYLLVDTSASMAYPGTAGLGSAGHSGAASSSHQDGGRTSVTYRMSKLEYAICLAAALGYLMIGQQDAVGLARFDSELRTFLPARSKRSHLTRIIAELAGVQPGRDEAGRGLGEALHTMARRVHKRGLMVVLSDFLADERAVLDGLHHLRFRGHDVILFQVLDWAEVEFPFEQVSAFEDPETGRKLVANPDSVRKAYLRALAEWTEHYRREAAGVRSDFVQVHTGMTFDQALIQFLINRQQRF
jgi:uncharacterized protein (DUF58 family)